MTAKNKKIISAFLIILIIVPAVLFSRPKKAEAIPVITVISDILHAIGNAFSGTTATATTTSATLSVKDVAIAIGKQILMAVAKRALQEMTKGIVGWINSGFHGAPLFLENPSSFFQDIAKSEVKTLVNEFGYDPRRFPFGKAFALNTISAYKRTLDNNAAYSLSAVINDPVMLNNIQTNFNFGGWNGFLINTQYPQNNYIGFQMIANNELAIQIQGTVQAPAQKIQSLLQQGQGFLSPQTCVTNTKFNTGLNEFQKPSLDYDKDHPFNPPPLLSEFDQAPDPAAKKAYDDYVNNYNAQKAAAEATFNDPNGTNVCPPLDNGASGFVNTTPGAVVANQITTALHIPADSALQAMGLGTDLSAVFNALLDHFLNKGLNALASTVNPPPPKDNFSYLGQTLGSPATDGTNSPWDAGPDQPIVLPDFKKTITDGISNTQAELALMDNAYATNPDPNNPPGVTQVFSQIWPKARTLDICIPGPDIGWQDRIDSEVQRNSQKILSLSSTTDGNKGAEASLVFKELQFASNFFKDWINNKMITELPSSILYIDAVNDTHTLSQQSDELTAAKRTKVQALARLQAINSALAIFTNQPVAGSAQDQALVSLWKQYKATQDSISNATTLENTKAQLATDNDKLASLNTLIPQCEAERKAKSWGIPGGATSSFSGTATAQTSTPTTPATPTINGIPTNSEEALFCSSPIVGGFTHATFVGPGTTVPQLPMVNAPKVLRYEITTIKSFFTSLPGNHTTAAYVNIQLSCNVIFNANILDYKGNLPGLTPVIETSTPLPDDTGASDVGTCVFDDGSPDQPGLTLDACTAQGGTLATGNNTGGAPLPADASTKHGDPVARAAQVANAKQSVAGITGITFTKTTPACDRFQITKEAARAIGGGAGLLSDPGGTVCPGSTGNTEPYAVDVIAFPDGYIYQVLDDTAPDGNGPIWQPASCGSDGTGICPDRYRPDIQ